MMKKVIAMSEEKAESTCSELTDGSKPWPDIVRLGDHIVHRLGLEDSVDTLGRWMAHRIAELIEQAEDGDEETKREATDLILRCWERRRGWTEGWPPQALSNAFKFADRERGRESDPEESTLPWASRLAEAQQSLDEEYQIWFSLALAEDPPANPPQDDDAWFFGDELEGDEDRITRLIAQVMVKTRTLFDELGVDATSVQRAELARREISRLSESRAAIFDEAAADEGG